MKISELLALFEETIDLRKRGSLPLHEAQEALVDALNKKWNCSDVELIISPEYGGDDNLHNMIYEATFRGAKVRAEYIQNDRLSIQFKLAYPDEDMVEEEDDEVSWEVSFMKIGDIPVASFYLQEGGPDAASSFGIRRSHRVELDEILAPNDTNREGDDRYD